MVPIDESEPFAVKEMFPRNSTEGLPVNTSIVLQFNHNIVLNQIDGITLQDQSGSNMSFKTHIFENALVLLPENDLDYKTQYKVGIQPHALTDDKGMLYEGTVTSYFRTGTEFNRLGGKDRLETNTRISQSGWKSADVAVLATSEDFPDALAAAPLAQKYNAPILLTDSKHLTSVTKAELERLGPSTVLIIGGTGAVSQEIEDQITSGGITCQRIWGRDRYETSLAIAINLNRSSEVFIVTGSNFPDALSIASYAAAHEIPILLSPADEIPPETQNFINGRNVTKSYLIGGTGVLSENVEKQTPQAERIAGADRYDTNFKVLNRFNYDFTYTFFATGENFPDALSGSALAGTVEAPIVLLPKDPAQDSSGNWQSLRPNIKMKYILGAEGVIPTVTMNDLFRT